MAKLKLESFREEIKNYLTDNNENLLRWFVLEGVNVREGVEDDVRKDDICYGIFFYLPYDLKKRMRVVCGGCDENIANIMISVIKEMGLYNNIK